MTEATTTTVSLDELADKIAAEGKTTDSGLGLLAKGIKEGFGELTALLKGKPKEPDDDDDDDDDKPEGGGDDKPEGGGDDKPADKPEGGGNGGGFQPMGKGGEDEELVDATPILLAMQTEIAALRKAVTDAAARNEALLQGVVELALAPLAKGVLHVGQTLEAVREIPAPVVEHAAAAGRAGKRRFGLDGTETKVTDITPVQMAKGLQDGIIDEDDLRWLKRGIAIPAERDGASKMDKVRAL